MSYTEVQVKNGKKYYYRALTVRDKGKFHKIRKYLGKELAKNELVEKEKAADLVIEKQSGKTKKLRIGEEKLYKQSGAGLALTIGLPMAFVSNTVEVEKGLTTTFPGDLTYATPDHQFLHYFSSERSRPLVEEIFKRMKKDPKWVEKRIKEFEKAVKGFESVGEKLIKECGSFSEKNREKIIKIYEKFLKMDYDYWVPSIFVDLFDPFEKEVVDFIFGEKRRVIEKEDLQFLLLPDRSVFWNEKEEFGKIRDSVRKNKLTKTDKLLWEKLKEHARKYWWMNNDYQAVQKLGASGFLTKLDENPEERFWKTLPMKKKKMIKKYSLDKKTVEKLKQFAEMAYLRDIRKKYTQMANYYVITFFHTMAKKLGIPVEWSNFVVPYCEYEKFLDKDKAFLKELEVRTKNGVLILSPDYVWRTRIETNRAGELLELVESHLKSGSLIYGNTASLGKAVGPAKIILRQADFHKFKEGDVLITGMTRPEFVPLMKIACAVVTDEGGVTSHAAIISRELGIPCVIATQTASKSFKDGDMLEVNANHGYVKILDRD